MWLTKAIYTIITRLRHGRKDGIVTKDQIIEILKDPVKDDIEDYPASYSEEEVKYILQVMRRFRMSYPISEDEEFVAALCTGDIPKNTIPKQYQHHFQFEYTYDGYLPDSVLHQLMVEVYAGGSRLEKTWKSGFNVHREDTRVYAVIDAGTKEYSVCIDVYSDTTHDNAAYLLTWIRDKMSQINSRLSLEPKQYIARDEGDRFELERLLTIRKRSTIAQGTNRDYDIDFELLGRIYSEEVVRRQLSIALNNSDQPDDILSKAANEADKRRKKLFISHASEDKDFVNELAELFSNLGFGDEQMFCSSFSGYGIPLSNNVNNALKEQFDNYDLYVVFVVSKNFVQSQYCNNEVGITIGKHLPYSTIAMPGFDPKEMKGMLNDEEILLSMDASEDNIKDMLNELYERVCSYCGVDKRRASEWERKRDSFINSHKA